mmetsp:Transcript_8817/g.23979  ORF Transcript_8817/g.23979 Transcript_8817/m.23979 type:complete len:232 (+) Transcript_8817:1639-2334(+)
MSWATLRWSLSVKLRLLARAGGGQPGAAASKSEPPCSDRAMDSHRRVTSSLVGGAWAGGRSFLSSFGSALRVKWLSTTCTPAGSTYSTAVLPSSWSTDSGAGPPFEAAGGSVAGAGARSSGARSSHGHMLSGWNNWSTSRRAARSCSDSSSNRPPCSASGSSRHTATCDDGASSSEAVAALTSVASVSSLALAAPSSSRSGRNSVSMSPSPSSSRGSVAACTGLRSICCCS